MIFFKNTTLLIVGDDFLNNHLTEKETVKRLFNLGYSTDEINDIIFGWKSLVKYSKFDVKENQNES